MNGKYQFEDAEHDELQAVMDSRVADGWELHSIGRYSIGFWTIWQRLEEDPDKETCLPF